MSDIINWNINYLIEDISKKNSEHALKFLYRHYFDKLMRFISIYIKSEQTAEEIISDVFLIIWQNRKSLMKIKNFNAYIYTITRNQSIDYLRTKKMDFEQLSEIPLDFYFRTDTTPEDDMITKELAISMDKAINSLPNQCKMAFKLIREDKMNYKDAAAILNISVKTLEAHITKAIKELRKALTSDTNFKKKRFNKSA